MGHRTSTFALKTKLTSLVAISVLALLPVDSFASPLADGNAAYKSGDFATAVQDFQQAVSVSSGVEQAKAYYKLGLSYRKEHDNSDALAAFKHASSVDPSLSFASSAAKFEEMEAKVGGGSQSQGTSASGSTDPVAIALSASHVYIEPSLQPYVNATTLAQAAENDDHTDVKIAILNTLPAGDGTPEQYAQTLHDYLNLGSSALILVAERQANGTPGGVAVSAGTLTSAEETSLAQKYVAQIGSGQITAGVSALSAATTSEIDSKERRIPDMVMTFVLVALVICGILIYAAGRRKKAEMNAFRIPLNTLRDNVLQNIQYIDNYADVLPKNNANTDQVKAFRQAAEAKFEQADKIMIKATDMSELYRAQSILDKANADLSKGRQFLDRATGGASKIPGDEAVRPPDLPSSPAEARQIPEQQRGVSFFSSQPAPLSGLVPVTLEINGQNRTVMATPEEADQIRMGRIPSVRAFNDNGRMVPWYNYQNYDPYRDYYQYQNQGWGGFGSGAVTGFIGAELLGSLFQPHYYGSWYSPYGYSPGFGGFGGWNSIGYDNSYDQGYFAGEQQANNYAFQDGFNQPAADASGGASFLGSGYDQSDYNSSGGSSFMGGGDSS